METPPMIFFSWALPGSLFWYGWTADKGVHWIVPIIATGLFGIGVFAVMVCLSYPSLSTREIPP